MAGAAGVEPTSAVLETVILPLNYTPVTNRLYHNFFYSSMVYIIKVKFTSLDIKKVLTRKKNNVILY